MAAALPAAQHADVSLNPSDGAQDSAALPTTSVQPTDQLPGQSQCSQCSHSPVPENAAVGKATSWSAPGGDASGIVSAHSSSQTSGELASLVVSVTEQGPHCADLFATDTTASEMTPNAEALTSGLTAGKVKRGLSRSVEAGDAINEESVDSAESVGDAINEESVDSAESAPLWMPVDIEAKLHVHRPNASSGRARMVGARRHHGCKPAWLRGRDPSEVEPVTALWSLLAIIGLYCTMAGLEAYGNPIMNMIFSLIAGPAVVLTTVGGTHAVLRSSAATVVCDMVVKWLPVALLREDNEMWLQSGLEAVLALKTLHDAWSAYQRVRLGKASGIS